MSDNAGQAVRQTDQRESIDAPARVAGLFRTKRRTTAAAAAVAGSVLVAVPLIGATSLSGGAADDTKPVAAEHQIAYKPDPRGLGNDWLPTPPKPAATKAPATTSPERASRSESRKAIPSSSSKNSSSSSSKSSSGSPKSIAQAKLAERGWSGQFSCLNSLWQKESGWRVSASNPSGAYGIPQALPGSKMASAGSDWRTNPATQIDWGLDYISETYGTPCAAWSHSQSDNWY
jgi:hypothetical protein